VILPKRGTNYDDLNERLAFSDDGLPVRDTGAWSRHKLALIAYYLPKFAELCTEKAHGWYFVDGFAGNGANRSPGFELAKGSALLGVGQEPAAARSILIELKSADAATLRERCRPFGDRVEVLEGDCNHLLPAALVTLPNRHLPAFCVLDPEGLELDWTTVEACAQRRITESYPYELLIYFSTPGAARSGGVRAAGYLEANRRRLTRTFGNESWEQIADQQAMGRLAPGEAGRAYLALYESQLRELGYTTVLDRPAVREDGNLVYHLVFASGNDAGKNIMSDALKRAHSGQMPLQL
jgi:three-Cys-motif partner protein